jgi:hypothetical protein
LKEFANGGEEGVGAFVSVALDGSRGRDRRLVVFRLVKEEAARDRAFAFVVVAPPPPARRFPPPLADNAPGPTHPLRPRPPKPENRITLSLG